MGEKGLFDEELRLRRLSNMGDPLEKLSERIDFEIFRGKIERALEKEVKGSGGRTRFDVIMMFKILLLQQWYNISDDNTEYLINDRLSFQRFLGLTLTDKVPDSKTIWHFREELKEAKIERKLFKRFTALLESQDLVKREGSLIDASFVDVPRQRNNREENKQIKEGEGESLWKEDVHKKSQKDVDARWTTKNKERHYGYKNHVKVDTKSKIILEYTVTSCEVHDSKEIVALLDEKDKIIYADSAYVGEELHEQIKEKSPEIEIKIHEKGYRNKPLTEEQKTNNNAKSKIRARVEHVFGYMTNSMGGMTNRVIGKKRNECMIALKNLAYNISRYVYLTKAPLQECVVMG